MTDPEVIREEIERTRQELGSDVDALADKVNPSKIAQRQTDKVKSGFRSVKDRVMGSAGDVKERVMGSAGDVKERVMGSTEDAMDKSKSAVGAVGDAVTDAPRKATQAAQGNPLAVGLIAFGVGWLASAFIPASDMEKKAASNVKDAAAPAVEKLKDAAKDAADNLKEPAKDAMQSVKETATDAVSNVKDEGADAASGLKDQAVDAKQNVQNTARS
jgi:gas vesicle protein